MAKPDPTPQPEMVEVRLLAPRFQHEQPGGGVIDRKRGDVFQIARAAYERDIEPDRGMGRPARARTFRLVADEKAAEQQKATQRQATETRISNMRESVRASEQALDVARAHARTVEADNARQLAETLKPMERPGAHRVG